MLVFVSVVAVLGFMHDAQAQGNFKVVQGRTISMPCYDPSVASQSSDHFVAVTFSPLSGGPDVKVCDYKIYIGNLLEFDTQFKGRVKFSATGDFILSNTRLQDEGKYACQLTGFGLPEIKKQSDLVVFVTPQIQVRKVIDPMVANTGKPTQAAECSARNGKPAAQVRWRTDNHLQFNQTKSNFSQNQDMTTVGSNLFIYPTKFYNGQTFFCEIRHPAFNTPNVTIILLNITYPPEDPAIIVTDDRKSLTCIANGNPKPTFTWILPDSASVATFKGATVEMINPSDPARSNDNYTCVASNGVLPDKKKSMTTGTAVTVVHFTQQANVGAIVGGVIGGLSLLIIVMVLVYYFIIKPSQEKDTGPYHYQGAAPYKDGSSRPIIEHPNESLHKNRPPSPGAPPPEERPEHELESSGSESDADEGNHDVDVEVAPATNYEQEGQEGDVGGITSRASINFQARRKRPSVSPAHRHSRTEGHMTRKESPAPKSKSQPRYDVPPGEEYDVNYSDDQPLTYRDDYQGHPDRYYDDAYNQPQFVGYPSQRNPPQRLDSLPQREPKYTEIDHSDYSPSDRRGTYDEPVEYAQIRHGYTHVV